MIADSPATCEVRIDGIPGAPALVFIHGWPDDAGLWRRQIAALEKEFRCVAVTLPNFGKRPARPGGYSFPRLVEMLAATIEELQPDGEPVTLITHDWGAYLGYLLEQSRPEKIKTVVALDVGGHVAPSGLREACFIMGYQWTLVLLWLIGGLVPRLGNRLTRRFARMLGVPRRQAKAVRSRQNYLYFYLWRGLLLPWWRKQLLAGYRPQCPVLFLWGRQKPVMFHSSRWLDIVHHSGGRSAGIEGAGHWLMETHADEINRIIIEWLAEFPAKPITCEGNGHRPPPGSVR